jgi:hypothetical protein
VTLSVPVTASLYLDSVLGSRPGTACLAVGYRPYRGTNGKYQHADWVESRFAWPAESNKMDVEVQRLIAAGDPCDIYVCPAVRHAGVKSRRKGDALPLLLLWVDLDGPAADPALEAALDGLTVASGSPGHRHLHILLRSPVDLGTWNRLQRALRDRLGGDDKIADNDLLRLPGTYNWKPTVPAAGHAAGDKAPVTVEKAGGRVWEADQLAAILGVDLSVPEQTTRNVTVTAEPAPRPLPRRVRWALDHPDVTDRSAAHHRLVCACSDAGLTVGQTLTVVSTYPPSREKFNGRLADEVARSWAKAGSPRTSPSTGEPKRHLNDLIAHLSRWLDVPDITHVLAALAVAVTAASHTGEPAWLLLVAPPSSGKTETVRVLDDVAEAHLDEVTIGGLLSWRPRGRGKPPLPSGVLSRATHGLLTIGDLSTLLATSDRGGRDLVFAALRRVYDGHYTRNVAVPGGGGTEGPLSWEGHLTVLGAVTGAIDTYSTHADQLGSRWLYCRIAGRDTAAKRRAATLARSPSLAEHRKETRALATQVVTAARSQLDQVQVSEDVLSAIEDAALVCCWGRATVPRHGYGRREIDGPVTVEEPMRVIRQLGTVAHGLAALGCTSEQTTAVCRRLALDSMPAVRRVVLEVLSLRAANSTTLKVALAAGIDRSVTRRVLEDLEAVGIVRGDRAGPDPADEEPDRRPCTWQLVEGDGDLTAGVFTLANDEQEVLRSVANTHTNTPN